jgi:hypothetical protein
MWSSVATKHLLESRLHILAAVEALADMDGYVDEYQKAVGIRTSLDEIFLDVENKTIDLCERLKNDDCGDD